MKNRFFTSRKGQSAIEYLMTYGWMLLVVAIVGGAVITTVQNNQSQCSGEIPTSLEVAQQGFGVSDFGVGNNGAQVVLENSAQDPVTVTNISIAGDSDLSGTQTLNVGETATFTNSAVSPGDSCVEINVEVTYDRGGLTDQILNGTIEEQATL
jgi:uncharacterized protein (UPF0333 family)